jgi:hypothetical protein
MQPAVRQLQQLDYNSENGGVFYVILAEELSWRKFVFDPVSCQLKVSLWSKDYEFGVK